MSVRSGWRMAFCVSSVMFCQQERGRFSGYNSGFTMSSFSPIIFASFIRRLCQFHTNLVSLFNFLLFDDTSECCRGHSGIIVYLLFTLTFHYCECMWKPYHHIDPLPSLLCVEVAMFYIYIHGKPSMFYFCFHPSLIFLKILRGANTREMIFTQILANSLAFVLHS